MAIPVAKIKPRALLKWLEGAVQPIFVLDHHARLIFANDSLQQFLRLPLTPWLGHPCLPGLDSSESIVPAELKHLAPPAEVMQGQPAMGMISGWIAPAIEEQASKSQSLMSEESVKLESLWESTENENRFELSDQGSGNATAQSASQSVPVIYLPIAIDRKGSRGCVAIVMLGQGHEQLLQHAFLQPAFSQSLQHQLAKIRSQYDRLDELPVLIGVSSSAKKLVRQVHVAVGSEVAVCVVAPRSSTASTLARGIWNHRLKRLGKNPLPAQIVPIDCSLMDADLLKSMLDLCASNSMRRGDPSITLLLENLDQLLEGAQPLLANWIAEHPLTPLLATSNSPLGQVRSQEAMAWSRIVDFTTTLTIEVPALKDRAEDVPVMAQHFANQRAKGVSHGAVRISNAAIEALRSYPWPAAEKELEQAIEQAWHASDQLTIELKDLPISIRSFVPGHAAVKRAVQPIELDQVLLQIEQQLIRRALDLSPRNRAKAARLLGISRTRLLRRIAQFGWDSTPGIEEIDFEEAVEFEAAPDAGSDSSSDNRTSANVLPASPSATRAENPK